tara:strand:- start:5262 stop:6152 length:891 start_codon:yes stop_codon:yes gene_type:complete
LISVKGLKIEHQVSLANFTTLHIGGPAEWLAEPKNIPELKLLLTSANEKEIPCRIIGAGSNLLINDSELKGLSLSTRKLHGSSIDPNTGIIRALSGEPLPKLARRAANAGLHGLEWAIGIPGTVGGAVVMNAGAQGGSIAETIISAEVMSLKGGHEFNLKNKELNFSYRNSRLQQENLIVLSACFQLEPGGSKQEINRVTNENLNKRTSSQPYHLHSCGSVFRNPEPLKAGKLIDSLGLKGKRIGGAEISTMHANFIINNSNATAADVKELIFLIQKTVLEKYGVLLHPEVKELGF